MRGRLIFPMLVDVARFDPAATAGPASDGFDDEFREPVVDPPAGGSSGRGTVRREETVVTLHAQVEDDSFEALEMLRTGRSPRSAVRLVFHFAELEAQGLLDPDGLPLLRINDRLVSIRRPDGSLVQNIPNPPGLFCTESQPRAFGLGGERNLLLMSFESRELSVR